MKNDIAIDINNVHMKFNLATEKNKDLKEYLIKALKGKLFYHEFWALRGVTTQIKRGEVFGIVGLNGAGKSTLLKVVAGVLKPTIGSVTVNGKIAPMIELGAGFDMELTARENIFLHGCILGFSKKFIDKKFDEIVDFSEMNEFLDVPMKNFSSGMVSRIAFAISTAVEPDIIIADEIMGVGDYKFQQKCETKIRKMIDNGVTVLLVTHSKELLEQMCNRAMLLQNGESIALGSTKEVMSKY